MSNIDEEYARSQAEKEASEAALKPSQPIKPRVGGGKKFGSEEEEEEEEEEKKADEEEEDDDGGMYSKPSPVMASVK